MRLPEAKKHGQGHTVVSGRAGTFPSSVSCQNARSFLGIMSYLRNQPLLEAGVLYHDMKSEIV